MKIVIIGTGEIGYDLASVLAKEKHDVTLLDRDRECLQKAAETLDVLTVEGNATSANDLVKARVGEAHILIAVTCLDEVNISLLWQTLPFCARVRSDEFSIKCLSQS